MKRIITLVLLIVLMATPEIHAQKKELFNEPIE